MELKLAIIIKQHEGNVKNENVIIKPVKFQVDRKHICTSI